MSDKIHITSSELANYVVCPEAWKLKREVTDKEKLQNKTPSEDRLKARAARKKWLENARLWARLKLYGKVLFYLMALLAFVVFLLETKRVEQPEFIQRILKTYKEKENGNSD